MVARVGEALDEIAGTGEEDETCALVVETTDVVEFGKLLGEECIDGLASLGIVFCANELARFIQHERESGLLPHGFAVELDVIRRLNPRGEIYDNLAVDLNAALGNQLVAPTTGGNPAGSEEAV